MKLSKEIKIGIAAVFAVGILAWGFNYLKGTNLFMKSNSVYAVYPKVPGLSVSAPIIINGVQSGVVDAIYFHPDKSSRVIVRLNITEDNLLIPKDSRADLISLDFLGSKAIGLKLGTSTQGIEPGDTLESFFEQSLLDDVSEQILPIKEKAENLMLSLDTAVGKFNNTLDNLNEVFNDRNQRNLSQALAKLNTTIEGFNQLSNTLNHSVKTKLNPTLNSFGELADSLKVLEINQTLSKAQLALDNMANVMGKMDRGEGTMGKLFNNDSLYNNLTAATKQMEELLEDIKLHPKRYTRILSRKEIPYKKDKKEK